MLCLSGFELYSRWVPLIIDFWRRFNAIPRRHGILWWYHVNKFRVMRGNRSELAPARMSPRCHVNTPLVYASTLFNRQNEEKKVCF